MIKLFLVRPRPRWSTGIPLTGMPDGSGLGGFESDFDGLWATETPLPFGGDLYRSISNRRFYSPEGECSVSWRAGGYCRCPESRY